MAPIELGGAILAFDFGGASADFIDFIDFIVFGDAFAFMTFGAEQTRAAQSQARSKESQTLNGATVAKL